MQYFKHSELANLYHVSLKTVHNWIGAAKEKKLSLQLHEAKSGTYVANTAENTHTLELLAEKGKKYRNTLHHKIIQPTQEFYEIYSRRQIVDIIHNLEVHREILRQYNYMQDGARHWDEWIQRIDKDTKANTLRASRELIHNNLDILDRLLEAGQQVNIIDLGAGNAYPVKELLGHLTKKKLLHRYIAIDISRAMLDIAEKNVRSWYGDSVQFEGHVRDMTFERFDDLLVEDMLESNSHKVINLVLLLGATPTNFRSYSGAFTTIYNSMRKNDLILYTDKIDSEASRRYFDFQTSFHTYILDLMNISADLYETEAGFDKEKLMRYIRVRLNTAVTIEFTFEDKVHQVIIEKGETILMLRIWHLTTLRTISEFDKTGFVLLHANLTTDRQFFLSISGVETQPVTEN